jgi:hypothetical protein
MAGWRERLRALRYRLLGNGTEVIPNATTSGSEDHSPQTSSDRDIARTGSAQRTVAINLGIDFGTSFTKVCFRDVGTEESGVVAVGEHFQQAIVPSVVEIATTGRLYLGDDANRGNSRISIAYLKMRLAGTPIGDALPVFEGFDLNGSDNIRALAAWFLASVIVRSQEWMALHQSDRLKNRVPVWSANVGVPVEHYDSDALKTFEEVLSVAWI